jgi:acyl-coenzyme A thioesterase PaaI-like protein
MIGPMALAVTTDLTFHFLKKPPPGDLGAHARTLQLGRRLAIADCTISAADDPRPLAHAVGTYALPESD